MYGPACGVQHDAASATVLGGTGRSSWAHGGVQYNDVAGVIVLGATARSDCMHAGVQHNFTRLVMFTVVETNSRMHGPACGVQYDASCVTALGGTAGSSWAHGGVQHNLARAMVFGCSLRNR